MRHCTDDWKQKTIYYGANAYGNPIDTVHVLVIQIEKVSMLVQERPHQHNGLILGLKQQRVLKEGAEVPCCARGIWQGAHQMILQTMQPSCSGAHSPCLLLLHQRPQGQQQQR